MTAMQLDLMDLLAPPTTQNIHDRAEELSLWEELFERYQVPAPFRCGDGREVGTPSTVVKCPLCGVHTPEGWLPNDHGYYTNVPDWRKFIEDLNDDPPSCRSARAAQRPDALHMASIPQQWADARPLGRTRSSHEWIDITRRVLTTMFGTDRVWTIAEREGWL